MLHQSKDVDWVRWKKTGTLTCSQNMATVFWGKTATVLSCESVKYLPRAVGLFLPVIHCVYIYVCVGEKVSDVNRSNRFLDAVLFCVKASCKLRMANTLLH